MKQFTTIEALLQLYPCYISPQCNVATNEPAVPPVQGCNKDKSKIPFCGSSDRLALGLSLKIAIVHIRFEYSGRQSFEQENRAEKERELTNISVLKLDHR